MTMDSRNVQIDIARGIGILLVVFGHSYFPLHSDKLFDIIFSFHVPLFFLLSGIFLRRELPFSYYVMKRADSLLKPYFITLIFLGIILSLRHKVGLVDFTKGMLYGNGSTLYWVQLWFLPHLFILVSLGYIYDSVISKLKLGAGLRFFLLLPLFFTGAYFIDAFWYRKILLFEHDVRIPGLPWSLDITPVTLFYFMAGYYSRRYILSFKPSFFAVSFSLLVFVICHLFFSYTIDLNLRRYDSILVSTAEALAGIYLVLFISHYLRLNNLLSKVISYIGRASLIILIFHLYVEGKLFTIFSRYFDNFISVGIASFVLGVLIPLILFHLIGKIRVLNALYFPILTRRFAAIKGTAVYSEEEA